MEQDPQTEADGPSSRATHEGPVRPFLRFREVWVSEGLWEERRMEGEGPGLGRQARTTWETQGALRTQAGLGAPSWRWGGSPGG